MELVMMTDPATGRMAIFREPAGATGAYDDPNSDRNAPLNNQVDWLDHVFYGSDLDVLEVLSDATVTINHAAVGAQTSGGIATGDGGVSGSGGSSENSAVLRYKAATADHLLGAHGETGYFPLAIALVGGRMLYPGMPVQTQSDGRGRYCSLYVTATQVRLYEWASGTNLALGATSLDYRFIVFRAPREAAGDILFDFNPETGVVTAGRGKLNSSRRYLQVVPAGTPLGIQKGVTADTKNGAIRFAYPDGSLFEPVPATLRGRYKVQHTEGTYTGAYGGFQNYNGAFIGSDGILVQTDAPEVGGDDGFFFEAAELRLVLDGKLRLGIPGRLVCLVPTGVSLDDVTLTFPDFQKSTDYHWMYSVKYVPFSDPHRFQKGEFCGVVVTATPEETVTTTVLADAPAGADFFAGMIRLNRLTAPQNTWMGRTLGVLPKENEWMPIVGGVTLTMEAEIGMVRSMSIYLDDDPLSATYRKLVMKKTQSVSTPVGGRSTGFSANGNDVGPSHSGGGIVNGANGTTGPTNGIPIFVRAGAKDYGYTDPAASNTVPTTYRWNGSNPCARGDTTIYTSVYQVDVRGNFGCRS